MLQDIHEKNLALEYSKQDELVFRVMELQKENSRLQDELSKQNALRAQEQASHGKRRRCSQDEKTDSKLVECERFAKVNNAARQSINLPNQMMVTQQQYCSPHPGYLPSHITNSQFNSEVPSTNKNALVKSRGGVAHVNNDQKQASEVQSPSLHTRTEYDDEGQVNKQILVSIGSMAKLKHPKRFWPKYF